MFIAKRTLTIRAENSDYLMEIHICAPVQLDKNFSCRYEIDWPDGTRARDVLGIDSVQALELALQMIGAELYTSTYHKQGQLVFEQPNNGYGFPVPHNMRDVLIGDDAKFY